MAIRNLQKMAVFAKVVEKGSFSAAAESLGVGKSSVSQHVSQLEEILDIVLLNRSTRSLTLTSEGRVYYERCKRIVEEAEAAESELAVATKSEAGMVRLTCPYNLGFNFVVPLLPEFRRLHPQIEVDLILEDKRLNMIDEGIDLSLRSGWLSDSSMFAITLAPMAMILVASSEYLVSHSPIHSLGDVCDHDWVTIAGIQHPERIAVENDHGEKQVIGPLRSAIRVNSGFAARSLIMSSVCIGMLPDYTCRKPLSDGRFVRLCPEWRSKKGTISAIFPSKHHMTLRSRLIIDFLKARIPSQMELAGSRVL